MCLSFLSSGTGRVAISNAVPGLPDVIFPHKAVIPGLTRNPWIGRCSLNAPRGSLTVIHQALVPGLRRGDSGGQMTGRVIP